MDHFDDRQHEDFRNSPFGYLAEVPEIQFSAQLIQQLVFRTIRTDKEYTLVTGLRCGVFSKGDDFDRVLVRRRLKERVGYRCLLYEFRDFWAKKFQKAKRRQEKEITYTIHGFPIAMQYDDPPVPVLDDIARTIVEPQFNASHAGRGSGGQLARQDSDDGVSSRRSVEDETARADDGDTTSWNIWIKPHQRGGGRAVVGPKKRLRTVKLEIKQHVMSECKKLRDFLATLGAPAGSTLVATVMAVDTEAGVSGSLPQDVNGGDTGTAHVQVFMLSSTNGGDIAPCLDDKHHPMPAATDEQLGRGQIELLFVVPDLNDGGAIEPSHAVPINDAEFEGCNITDGDGDLTEVPVPATVVEPGHGFPMTRRRSARLRRPAPATRTPCTRGTKRTKN
ncbi:Hypothetical predicted protein [Olea europaea subsp. europaea]|uniref:Uncharacterized protein n=1 Tax=Olea europaea subsp. europaea TaxID=158383 RepID=A0A8S0T8D1_OLEEU|nr:Hypothetical predicted protein [Olea europaea subsp. europaea]